MIRRFKRFFYRRLGLYDEALKYRLLALLAADTGNEQPLVMWEIAYGKIWDICGGRR